MPWWTASVTGMSPDPEGLARISLATGLHVVAATGFYIQPSHPTVVSTMSEEDLAALMVKEITQGVSGTSVKAGIIGEIGCSWPLHPDERRWLAHPQGPVGRRGWPFPSIQAVTKRPLWR